MHILYDPIAKKELSYFDNKVQRKFRVPLAELRSNNKLSSKQFKKLAGYHALYELRVKHDRATYRSICGHAKQYLLVVLFFQKKGEKPPSRYINNAINRLRSFKLIDYK